MTTFEDVPLPGLAPEPAPQLSAALVARALDVPGARLYRWLRVIGVEARGQGYPLTITRAQAVACLAVFRIMGEDRTYYSEATGATARTAIRAAASGQYPWLFVCRRWVIHAHSAEQVLTSWRAFGSPTGTILSLERLGAALDQALADHG